ncbi:vWA domain-containing protein [Aeromicrobium wangtongii]|uniref:vWA domain-containing protein n=1 Tax=Aeromicrobium wangtongii TaxID=2969247 RepID=UPI002016D349|nr:VWA domain-containing protein [Aeromicrobium wangtongii]MCL3819261.1 VWA domain-containing protein [Aeromicrobium wangtongii]
MSADPARSATPPRPASQDLAGRLVELVAALRSKGIPAGTSETVDAAAVIEVLGMSDRHQLREGLAAALVRRGGQREVFDMAFDIYFPAGVGTPQAALDVDEDFDVDDLREQLAAALAGNDARALDQLADIAVDLLGRVGTEGTASNGFSAYLTLDRLRPQTLLVQAMQQRGQGGGGGSQGSGQSSGAPSAGSAESAFTDRIERDEIRRNIDRFRERVAGEARRRTAELRGRDTVTRHAVRSGTDRIDFLSANKQQLEELARTVQPLSRKLATRLAARRRKNNRGRIDIRRTLRRSMSTGGVPMHPAYAKPHPARPELVLLCDVSGSVAGFSSFTMHLVQALSGQFSKIRVFAFVNAMAEVTDLVKESAAQSGQADLAARIAQEARITKWHTSSDYGEAFADFRADFMTAIGPRTAVLILGDARNNNQDPNLGALHEISQRARRTFWLNPEATMRWGLGDSVAPAYAEVVEMHQCSNVDQLTRFVTRLLPV